MAGPLSPHAPARRRIAFAALVAGVLLLHGGLAERLGEHLGDIRAASAMPPRIVVAYVRELGLDAIVVIGGDGSMAIAHQLAQRGVPIVGCPKTIDNDLEHTDRSFGFDTAVAIVTDALDRLQTTGQSHGRVMILETMGRYAGWIALHAGLAGGARRLPQPERRGDLRAGPVVGRDPEGRAPGPHRLTGSPLHR